MELTVVALGGNSLVLPGEEGTEKNQIKRIEKTVSNLKISGQLVIVHGNGPQVGNLFLQQEKFGAGMGLDTLDAMTQGQLGYWIQQSVWNILGKLATAIITRVLVDKKDASFKKPSKPIGPYYKKRILKNMIKEPEGWRRVVPSPKPKEILDIEEIRILVKSGFVTIVCGGGGIPVVKEGKKYRGVEAVIDKDRTAQKVASQLKADTMLFVTDVDYVYYNYGKKDQKAIRNLDLKTAGKYLKEGQFGKGSMGPKIESSIQFLKNGGKRAIITSPEKAGLALKGRSGTVIE